ncbi:MAG: serine protein kinase PrkA [Candidatus Kapaibacteriales bacterium]
MENNSSSSNVEFTLHDFFENHSHFKERDIRPAISFENFTLLIQNNPKHYLRNIFQFFYDMIFHYIEKLPIKKANKIFSQITEQFNLDGLLVENCDNPFFSDNLFAKRFLELVSTIKRISGQNRLILFEGPPGSGKSTFLNNLIQKVEEYASLPEGALYKTYWRIDTEVIRKITSSQEYYNILENGEKNGIATESEMIETLRKRKSIDFSCPRHDHPILQIPKQIREEFISQIIKERSIKEEIFSAKEYEWIFHDEPCNICQSLFNVLLDRLKNPAEIYKMIFARKSVFKRLFGVGISVFNPSDPLIKEPFKNDFIEKLLRQLLRTDNIDFTFSYLSYTNNGIYALMDIKENNRERLFKLHGIISDGIHKVGLVEEKIKSLFLGLVNPEDKVHFEGVKSFQDRIIYLKIPYVLDYTTELQIYKQKFGANIKEKFLPNVLENFAKIVIATRLQKDSKSIRNWISDPSKYQKFIDKYFLHLKLLLYSGEIPEWLQQEDFKNLDKKIITNIIIESENDGFAGISGRQSIQLLGDVLEKFNDEDFITMEDILQFFQKSNIKEIKELPEDFIQCIANSYDFKVLQEVKESIYYYNREEIENQIANYLFAINYDIGDIVRCPYTNDDINVTEEFLTNFEKIMVGANASPYLRAKFRREMLQTYVTITLTQEIQLEKKEIKATTQFKTLFSQYINYLKENALAPYLDNEIFKMALKEFNTSSFDNYDDKLKRNIRFLFKNLINKFGYSVKGAVRIVLYVLERNLDKKL